MLVLGAWRNKEHKMGKNGFVAKKFKKRIKEKVSGRKVLDCFFDHNCKRTAAGGGGNPAGK